MGRPEVIPAPEAFLVPFLPLPACPWSEPKRSSCWYAPCDDTTSAAFAHTLCHTCATRTNTWTHGMVPEQRQMPSFSYELSLWPYVVRIRERLVFRKKQPMSCSLNEFQISDTQALIGAANTATDVRCKLVKRV